jgi:hypothetical protein
MPAFVLQVADYGVAGEERVWAAWSGESEFADVSDITRGDRPHLRSPDSRHRNGLARQGDEFNFIARSGLVHVYHSPHVAGRQPLFREILQENDAIVFLNHVIFSKGYAVSNRGSRMAKRYSPPDPPSRTILHGRRQSVRRGQREGNRGAGALPEDRTGMAVQAGDRAETMEKTTGAAGVCVEGSEGERKK